MKKSLIILFLSTSFLVQGQEVFPDSVKTNREKAIYLNAFAKKQKNFDSIIKYYNQSILLLNSKCDSVKLSSLFERSYYSYHSAKYKNSLAYALFLDSLNKTCNNNYFNFKVNLILGDIYNITDQKEKGLKCINKSILIAKEMKDSLLLAESYYNLGSTYFITELNTRAKEYFLLSLKTYEDLNVRETVKYRVYSSLINVVENKKEVDYYLNKSHKLAKSYKNPYYLAYYYTVKGSIYRFRNFDKVEAKKASLIGLKMSDSLNYIALKNITLTNLGHLESDLKNYSTSIKYLNSALKINHSNLKSKALIYESLINSYAGLKNYKKAFRLSKELIFFNDSITKLNNTEQFAKFDSKFKVQQKDKEIAQQKLELAQQKNIRNKWIFGSLAFVLLGFTAFQWRNNKQRRQKLLAETKYKNEQEINELRTKFLGNIAHEIRTPLTLILGNLELAKENIDIKNKAIQNINIAITNSKKVVEDANEILELLKFEKSKISIKLNIVLLDATLKRIFLSFKSLAEIKKIKLQYQSAIHKNYQTKIDIEKVEKILNNLISNAVKYSPSNSEIIFYANIINSSLIIKITDFGQGIHFNETEKIFQRFYQASNSQSVGGIGIGLSLAKEFAELLKGTLAVKSEINKGSTFTFILPIIEVSNNYVDTKKDTKLINRLSNNSEKTPIKDQSISKNKTNKGFRKSKILIVEDNPEMNNYLAEILSDHYHCTTAFDGIEALQKMKNEKFDLITSDIMMPNLDGFQFRKKVNEINEYKNIPFILISAKTLTEDKIKGFQLGIDDYVIKPFDKNELLARIDNLLLHKGARDAWQINNKDLISNAESSDKKLLEKIKSIVIKNISDETFKINELSKNVGYSQRQLNRILKQYTGLSPVKFILEIRLQKAYQNLQNNTFFSLSEVRYDVGITSSSYFNKSFKNRFGIMPKDLLKNQ